MLISRRLLDVAHRLDRVRQAEPLEEQPVPIESLGYDGERAAEPLEEQPVPIESLGYDGEPARVEAPEASIVPIASLAPDEPVAPEGGGLEASFRTFELLLRQRGPATPSLAVLLGPTAGADGGPAPASATPTAAPVLEPDSDAVAIGSLCYRGHAALERANQVRHQIAHELGRNASFESLQPLYQELLDLVPLALEQA
jgi:hypothetical protein